MKKVFSLLSAILVIAAIGGAVYLVQKNQETRRGAAANETSSTILPSTISKAVGDTLLVTVTINTGSTADAMSGAEFEINYDNTKIEYLNSETQNGFQMVNSTINSGSKLTYKMVYLGSEIKSSAVQMVKINFKALSGGDQNINLSNVKIQISGQATTWDVTTNTSSTITVGGGGGPTATSAPTPTTGAVCDAAIVATFNFDDVPSSHWAIDQIRNVRSNGITAGCGGNNYCPDTSVTRAQAAVMLVKAKYGSDYVPPVVASTFADVPSTHWAASFIEKLAADGVTAGCSVGNFCPDGVVSRAQVAVMLVRYKYGSTYTPPAATGVFSDVPVDFWAASWIEKLAADGVSAGCTEGRFCPNAPVTRAQMAVLLVKNFNIALKCVAIVPPTVSPVPSVIETLAKEGELCGGIAGKLCEPDLMCDMSANPAVPDGAGICIKPVAGAGMVLNYKMSFSNIKPADNKCLVDWPIQIKVTGPTQTNIYTGIIPNSKIVVGDKLVFGGSLNLVGTKPFTETSGVAVFISGPKHLQMKYGKDLQTTSYGKAGGELTLTNGATPVYDFSGYPLLAGDVVANDSQDKQDGVINGVDFAYIKSKSLVHETVDEELQGKPEGYLKGDLDGNCQINSNDVYILKMSLQEKQSELY